MKQPKNNAVLPFSVDVSKEKLKKRLRKKYESQEFKEDIKRLKNQVASGYSLWEARENMLYKDNQAWDDLVAAVSMALLSPETLVLEWQIRQQTRYMQAVELFNLSRQARDLDQMARAIILLNKIDESDINLKKALGLLRPVQFDDDGTQGVSNDDVEVTRRRFERIVEERIVGKLIVREESPLPVPLDVLVGHESQSPSDQLEETPVVDDDPSGQQQGDSIPEV